VDSAEALLLLDGWLRQTFIPDLDSRWRMVVASRFAPGAPWRLALEWRGLIRELPLGALPDRDAVELLMRCGEERLKAERLNRIARGHPLGLRLAAAAGRRQTPPDDAQFVIQQLATLYLQSVGAEATRKALEAAAVVQWFSPSLAEAMLGASAGDDGFAQLAGTSFADVAGSRLFLHDAVRDAIAAHLEASDPPRFAAYRMRAWQRLRHDARAAGRDQMWMYTSGMIYLLRNPVVREAFFPIEARPVHVEPAVAGDGGAIAEIAGRHETPAAERLVARWWQKAPQAFRVVRHADGTTAGFYLLLELRDRNLSPIEEDPLIRAWRRHLREHPMAPGQTVVFLRRWLSAQEGELPSVVQAACWLDVKRSYMELRPKLRRCYIALCDLATYEPTAARLGFQAVGAACLLDGVAHHLAVLDFGPDSVDGWIDRLLGGELGATAEWPASRLVDRDRREMVLDGQRRIALTTLEFELLCYLEDRAGKAVSRAEILAKIWQRRADSSSNVVDVLVRSLRSKMGGRAMELATIRGVGYALRPPGG
jgi:hypothetical protein